MVREADVPANLPNLSIDSQGETATVEEGVSTQVNVTVENNGSVTSSYTPKLTITNSSNALVKQSQQTTSQLAPGENETVSFSVGTFPAGDYSVEVATSSNATTGTLAVELVADLALSENSLKIGGTSVFSSLGLSEGDAADLTVNATSRTEQEASGSVTVLLFNSSGTQVEQRQSTTFGSSEQKQLVFTDVTSDLRGGQYGLVVMSQKGETLGQYAEGIITITQPLTGPSFVSAEVTEQNPDQLRVTFDEAITAGVADGFTFDSQQDITDLATVEANNKQKDTVVLNLSSPVQEDQDLSGTLQYDDGTGGVQSDTNQSPAEPITNGDVTNNVVTELPDAPYVNKSEDTFDPTTETTISVTYNATGEVASPDVGVRLLNDSNLPVVQNLSLDTFQGSATLTIPANSPSFSGDSPVTYQLINTAAEPVPIDSDLSWLNATSSSAPTITNLNLGETNGNVSFSFDSDEELGTTTDDITVEVVTPSTATLTFNTQGLSTTDTEAPFTYKTGETNFQYSSEGTYTMEVKDAKDSDGNNGGTNGDGSGLTDDYFFDEGLPNAPYVNNTDQQHDPTTDTSLSVDYNATDQIASADVNVTVSDSEGTTVAFNNSLLASEGTAA
ncbi:CARDB domain-containing protein [Halovenus salina]|uniref:CARDB domain-containing protein n=1 Tax=Halovenus salina TaxID=1510225 RepID=A0ABD5W2K5_9EURY